MKVLLLIYNFNTNQTKPSEKEKEEINKSIKNMEHIYKKKF